MPAPAVNTLSAPKVSKSGPRFCYDSFFVPDLFSP